MFLSGLPSTCQSLRNISSVPWTIGKALLSRIIMSHWHDSLWLCTNVNTLPCLDLLSGEWSFLIIKPRFLLLLWVLPFSGRFHCIPRLHQLNFPFACLNYIFNININSLVKKKKKALLNLSLNSIILVSIVALF